MKAVPNLVYLKLSELSEKVLKDGVATLKLVLVVPLNDSWLFVGCCVTLNTLNFLVRTVKKLKLVKNTLTPKKIALYEGTLTG
jgi:hypothetical protein|tara:strand:- start:120 stop:368 length:249 start_codon:yes stop_codon:yes gene_type:complete